MSNSKVAVFLGGVAADSPPDHELAYGCGRTIGRLGYSLFHGGYNGLMEDAARGASIEGAEVVAITLANKKEWGDFNPYVTRAFYVIDLGKRLNAFFSNADVVVAMGGGIGTLHEIAAAIWYAGNVRRIPVILLGARAQRLLSVLKEQSWIYESPTRPVDFLHVARSIEELDTILENLHGSPIHNQEKDTNSLKQRLFDMGMVNGNYVRADGRRLDFYFDPFRLCTDPNLIHDAAMAMAAQVNGPFEAVAGIALGGVALATHVAAVLGISLLIVRPIPKAYGTYAQVEGLIKSGSRALLVDDVVRHGTSILSARRALKEVNVDVAEAACVLSYGRSGNELLREQGVILHSLIIRADHGEPKSKDVPKGA